MNNLKGLFIKIKHSIRKRSLPLSAVEIFIQQNCVDNLYNRMDTVVRYLAIECYFGENDFGFDLYKKMQSERKGQGYGEVAEKKFRSLIASFEKSGYDLSSKIILDKNLALVDGSHRLALALYLGIDVVSCKVKSKAVDIRYDIMWFIEHGFSLSEIQIISCKCEQLLGKYMGEFACVLWPPVEECFDEITKKLSVLYEITEIKDYTFTGETFARAVKGIYSVDDIAEWKIEKKINGMERGLQKIRVVGLRVERPRFRLKEINGHTLSMEGECIKKAVRNAYKAEVPNYFHDIIIHMGDNYAQSRFVISLLDEHFSLVEYMKMIRPYPYIMIKPDKDDLMDDFPERYPFGGGIDIICEEACKRELVGDTIEFATRNRVKFEYTVRHTAHKNKDIIRIEKMGCLIFQFNIATGIDNLSQKFVSESIKNREKYKECYIPRMSDKLIYCEHEFRRHRDIAQKNGNGGKQMLVAVNLGINWWKMRWLRIVNKNKSESAFAWIGKSIQSDCTNPAFVYCQDLGKIVERQVQENKFAGGECIAGQLDELKQLCTVLEIDMSNVLVVGSMVLEYYGIRESKDIDFILTHGVRSKFEKGAQMLSRNTELVSENYLKIGNVVCVDDDELINNSLYYTMCEGVKIAKLSVVWAKKYYSKREKDVADLKLIHERYVEDKCEESQ